jgi:protease-4
MSKIFAALCLCLTLTFNLPADEKASDQSPAASGGSEKKPTKTTVAMMTVKGSLPESAGQLGLFGELEVNLAEFLTRLDRLANDKAMSGVVLKIRNPDIGPGKVREVREAISRVRKAGKKVTAQLESAASPDYLVACACDEILMPESGEIMIPGVRAEVMFYKGLFDLVGIQPDMMQVGDFKGAAEPYTRTEMSAEFRKQYEVVLDDLYNQMVEIIATDRTLDPAKVRELIDVGIFLPADAKAAGLIDEVVYDDELKSRLAKKLEVEKVDIADNYGKAKVNTDFSGMTGMFELFNLMLGDKSTPGMSNNKKLAVIYASGMIMSGDSMGSLLGGQVMGSDTIVKAIRQASEDKNVIAIVLRVDSPGGSALASDQIWRALQQCEKPVVASMGDVAASGGYYISMGCDKIFAEPGTVTGSIGVVGGKLVLKGLFDKIGLKTEVISRGKNSGILSEMTAFSDSERSAWKKMMDEVYRQFLTKTAAGRKMDLAKLESLAGGRIWTGRQAKDAGLVDEIGTLRDAIAEAKKLSGHKPEEKFELLVLPKPKTFLDQLLEGDVNASAALQSKIAAMPEPWQHLAKIEHLQRMLKEPTLYLMPYQVHIR